MRLLVVEDNPKMAAVLRQGLVENGYAVDVANTGHDGEHMAATEPYDVVILDVMLPDQDGMQACKNLRRRGLTTPILMLTALSTTGDKVKGLDAGADDYLTKPFEFDELLARVRALLRRGDAQESSRLKFADLEVDLLTRAVSRAGQKVKLTAKEFALLECLLSRRGRAVARTDILRMVWDDPTLGAEASLEVLISRLRRKLSSSATPCPIRTHRGYGYSVPGEP